VVIRIVYDGPPLSGKTASLHALRAALKTSGELFSPGAEDGRTRYFDWLDYTGGTFGGRALACQIISVPGQPSLRARRHELLRSADVVVFVADSTPAGLPLALDYFAELQKLLQSLDPPPAILLQANKQDLPGALKDDDLKLFFPAQLRLTHTVATEYKGVRETFVFAVRLALERLQKMLDSGKNMFGTPEVPDGQVLLENLENTPCPVSDADQILENILQMPPPLVSTLQAPHAVTPVATEMPCLPSADLPRQSVFPAGSGHELLTQLAIANPLLERRSDGAWDARAAQGWRCYSRADWCYDNEAEAHQALHVHVRTHIYFSPILSTQRAVAIADNGQGQWRLWQITRSQKNLAQLLQDTLHQNNAKDFARALVNCADQVYQAFRLFSRYAPHLPVTLDAIGIDETPVYIGLLDPLPGTQMILADPKAVRADVRAVFAEPLGFALAENQLDPLAVLHAVQALEDDTPQAVAILSELFAPYLT
jgi:GTPase SAR1 family protein